MDIFSIPEMNLLAAANDFFISNDIDYDPVHLFKDVSVRMPSNGCLFISAPEVLMCCLYLWLMLRSILTQWV